MPSIVQNMAVATRTLVTERLDSKSRPTMVLVDNVNGAADADRKINHRYTRINIDLKNHR